MTMRREGLVQTGAALALLMLWGIVWAMTVDLPEVAAAYPRFILLLLIGSTAIYLLLGVTRIFRPNYPADTEPEGEVSESPWRPSEDQPHELELTDGNKAQRKRVIIFMAGVLLYAIAVPYLGFDVTTAIFLVVAFKSLMNTRTVGLILIAAAPFILQFVTDIVLGVALPEGFWR